MAATVEPSYTEAKLSLSRVELAHGGDNEFARVTLNLFANEGESSLAVSIKPLNRNDDWETELYLTPHQIRALHSFLGFVLGEARACGDSAPRDDAARSEPPA